jgi:hypothetical protein
MTDSRGRINGNTIVLDEPVDIPDGSQVMVHVEPLPQPSAQPRRAGIIQGKAVMAPDFNDTPPGFEEYLP